MLGVAIPALVPAFGSLFGMTEARRLGRERVLAEAAEDCRASLNNSLGVEWISCVITNLRAKEAMWKAEGRAFPFEDLREDELERLLPGGHVSANSDELMNLMRNFSCEVADGGSQPVRSFVWTYKPVDPCAATDGIGAARSDGDDATKADGFKYHPGFLPAGNDLYTKLLTEREAREVCAADMHCLAFTFQADDAARGPEATHNMMFKSLADGQTAASGWHAWHKLHLTNCSTEARAERTWTRPHELTVHVLRESPPVYLVDDFVDESECDYMLDYTMPRMGRSVVGGGGFSNWRRSYSVNMVPDFEWEEHPITRVCRRKFAFAREVAGYDVQEGAGQEPINAVYYKDDGDQYRPHCDGECRGNAYTLGSRVASSLTYCTIAERGGYTLFTRVGLKVVPKRKQMLFFGYFFNASDAKPGVPMDNGHTEHTGCPLHEGKKWIATMWYREGVTAEKNWEYWSNRGREGV